MVMKFGHVGWKRVLHFFGGALIHLGMYGAQGTV